MSIRTFVTTDTHGCNKELNEVLSLANFDFNNDILVHIGDCTDRGPDSFGVIETLLKIKNLISIRGNHDEWMLQFITQGYHPSLNHNGVYKTFVSYMQSLELDYDEAHLVQKMSGISTNFSPKHMPTSHKNFFKNQRLYYVDDQNRLFVHAGFDPMEKIQHQNKQDLVWDRTLVQRLGERYEDGEVIDNFPDVNFFKRIFVGHTPTIIFKEKVDKVSPIWLPGGVPFSKPMYMGQLVNLDTGCCFGNHLSLIDITDDDNHILYQSSKHEL